MRNTGYNTLNFALQLNWTIKKHIMFLLLAYATDVLSTYITWAVWSRSIIR